MRAAGESHLYTWQLQGTRRGEEYTFGLPSVTHCMKSVKDLMGFGAMAWWGYKIGIEGMISEIPIEEDLEVLYERMKLTDYTPNKIRDARGVEGTEGHDVLEQLALETIVAYRNGDVVHITGDPPIIAKLQGKKQAGAKQTSFVPEEYQLSAANWWLDNEAGHDGKVIFPERPVWSLRYLYQGTLDLAREWSTTTPIATGLEVVDYKTHKPMEGRRKDGTYRPGEGPARPEDLWQLAAYARAVEELALGRVIGTRVVLLDSDGGYLEDTRRAPFEDFLAVKALHDRVCPKKECRLLAAA